ncbi:GNAT family N-acetyltransferase [Streptomyces sp. NPDC089919]|uniref:GNAT family N-acetyltransferase n=1 Tax=Streptomyces sp. NPDC089919 TaxID=3155188 RepID=UPI00343CB6A5
MRVRAMTAADVEAVAAIRVTGWQAAYAGILPQHYLDAMTVEEDVRLRRRRFSEGRTDRADLVAVDAADRVLGWACLGPYRGPVPDPDPERAELYALYVEPALVGSGVGRTLMAAVHAEARDRGFAAVLLWVLEDNARARRFYERAGYTADGAVQSEDYDGAPAAEVRYGRRL